MRLVGDLSMDKFKFLVDEQRVAAQVAALLNNYNRLNIVHTKETILSSDITYLIKQLCVDGEQTVVGCIGLQKVDNLITTLRHLSVTENKRREGIGAELVTNAMQKARTRFVQMHIRHDNMVSLSLATRLGFLAVSYDEKDNYYLITVKKEVNA